LTPLLGAFALLAVAPPIQAAEIGGSADLSRTETDANGVESKSDRQRFSLFLHQELAPYLKLELNYSLQDLESRTAGANPSSRRSRSPSLRLRYRRPKLSASLFLTERTLDTSTPEDDLKSDTVGVNVNWRPRFDLTLFGDFLDQTAVADVAVFGRDSRTRSYGAGAAVRRSYWSTSYRYRRSEFASMSQFRSRQDRHQVRLTGNRAFFDDRLAFSLSSSLSRLERQDEVAEGAELVTPVPAVQGLFAVDTRPELGELVPRPGLIDGDFVTPVAPPIDIGGAATLRNLGLDLGVSTQVSRLEVGVDALSGSEVVWQVYQSPDNFVWSLVDGVTSGFDEALLRYTLRFPQVTSRYIKAVNVSTNLEPIVRVTELRALIDIEAAETGDDLTSQKYRYSVSVSYRPAEWLRLGADAGASNDEDVSAGLVRRDYNQQNRGASILALMPGHLSFQAAYRFDDIEDLREPVLLRTVEAASARLAWAPLPTVDAALVAARREESEAGSPLTVNDSVGLRLVTEFFPTLRLTSDLRLSKILDRATGVSRETRTWEERIQAQPLVNWTVNGSYRYSRFEAADGFPLRDQQRITLFTRWTPSAFLSLGGHWSLLIDDETFLQQSYNISYTPGKLRLSGSHQESATRNGLATRLSSVSLGYRLNRQARLDSSLSTSRTSGGEMAGTEITTLSVRLRVSF